MSREKILNTIAKSNASIISNLDSQRIRDKKSVKEVIDHLYNENKFTLVDATYLTTEQDVADYIRHVIDNTEGRVDIRFYGQDQIERMSNLLSDIEVPIVRNLSQLSLLKDGSLNHEKVSFWKATNLEKAPINYIDLIYNNGIQNTSIINLILILKDA